MNALTMPDLRRPLKRLSVQMRNAPLTIFGIGMIAAYEVYSAGGIFQTSTEEVAIFGYTVPLAPVEAVISLGCGLGGFLGAFVATQLACDPRPEVRRNAWKARLLAVMMLIIPTGYLANSFSLQAQLGTYREYHGSVAEQADMALVKDFQADSRDRSAAAERLRDGVKPERAKFSLGAWAKAIFLTAIVNLAGAWFFLPAAETAHEARNRTAKERAAKAAATRQANKLAAEKLAKKLARQARKAPNVEHLFRPKANVQ